jgi:hypothetical protein
MESFSRGWSFLKQAWSMALQDQDLIRPSIYALIVGSIISVIGAIPIIVAAIFLGEAGRFGQFVLAVMGAFLVFVNFVVSYVFSGMTVYLIYEYLTRGNGKMSTAWSIVRRDFFDLAALAAASTVVNVLKNAARRSRQRGGGLAATLLSSATGLLEVLWTEVSYLILPAMVIEDIGLVDSAKRVAQIVRDNLLLVGISTVGVRAVTGLIGFVLSAAGAVLGFGMGYGIIAILGTGALGLVFGIGLGVLIFFMFTMVASVISTYTSTAYHTCLYLWAREVEKAQTAGLSVQITAPAPLAAVLS